MNASSQIHARREILQEIQRHDSPKMLRTICPACRGGSTGEKSLTIRRAGMGYSYICWRGTCGLGAGHIDDSGVGKNRPKRHGVRSFVSKSFQGWSYNLVPTAWNTWPISKTGSTLSDYVSFEECVRQGWKLAAFAAGDSPSWLRVPVYNYRQAQLGDLLRGFYATDCPPCDEPEEVGGKILTFREIDEPWLYFPQRETGTPYKAQRIVVVEDPISAVVVNDIAPCCALLGSNMTSEQVEVLRLLAPKELVMMLDGDPAGHIGAQMAQRKYSMLFSHGIRVVTLLGKDPKDLSLAELSDLIMTPLSD